MYITTEDVRLITELSNAKMAPCHIARKFGIKTEEVRNICKANGAFVGGYKSRMRDYNDIDNKIRKMVSLDRYSQTYIAQALQVEKPRVLAIQIELGKVTSAGVIDTQKKKKIALARKVDLLRRDGMSVKDACKAVSGISQSTYHRIKKAANG